MGQPPRYGKGGGDDCAPRHDLGRTGVRLRRSSIPVCTKARRSIMRLCKIVVLALVVGATGSMSVSAALAAPDCPKLVELADWGENSAGDISVAPGQSCLFPITI